MTSYLTLYLTLHSKHSQARTSRVLPHPLTLPLKLSLTLTLAVLVSLTPCGAQPSLTPTMAPTTASTTASSVPQTPPLEPQEAYRALFEDEKEALKALFSSTFLRVIPTERLLEIRERYLKQLGAFVSAELLEEGRFKLTFEGGEVESNLSLADGLITSLWLGPPALRGDQLNTLKGLLSDLEGEASVLILKGRKEVIFEHNARAPLSVGSAFKLYVLKALLNEVEAGQRSLSDVVRLNRYARSLPSGILQDWPLNTPVTLGTLAALMISRSDNTATDHLIDLLGRQVIERVAPATMSPFLSTREAFLLKWGDQLERRTRYQAGQDKTRRGVLKELSHLDVSEVRPSAAPIAIKAVEWQASAYELCEVMWALRESDLLSINPGLASPSLKPWSKVSFKGGSEPGVLNYTHLLTAPVGAQGQEGVEELCVVATINNPKQPINEPLFTSFTSRLTAQAARSVTQSEPAEPSRAQAAPHKTTERLDEGGDDRGDDRGDEGGDDGGDDRGDEPSTEPRSE